MRETNKVRILRARVFSQARGKKLQIITVSILSWVSVKQVRSGLSKVVGIIMNRNRCKITLQKIGAFVYPKIASPNLNFRQKMQEKGTIEYLLREELPRDTPTFCRKCGKYRKNCCS